MTEKSKRICVGEIATAHGVRGLVKLRVLGEDAEVLQEYGPLYTTHDGNETLRLRLKHRAGGAWVAEIEGVADRDAAAALRGTALWLPRENLPEIEGGFYHDDLLGLVARDEAGNVVGTVRGVDNFGAGDLLDIQPEGRKSFYLPFADIYVLELDPAAGILVVDVPEGLVEE